MSRISHVQGKGSLMHNRRDYFKGECPEHIDQTRTQDNVTLVDKDMKEAYEEIFGASVERYNAKQTRADRKIDDYLEKIKHSKNGEKVFYEDVVQWGSKEDFERDPSLREKAKDALVEYAENFEKRNPTLKVIGSYVHMDEASPHLHLDYVPVAHGYKRGMDTRNSLDRAMRELGHAPENGRGNKKDNATKSFREHERDVFKLICKHHGLETEKERSDWGRERFTSVLEYKEMKDSITQEKENQMQQLTNEMDQIKSEQMQQLNEDLEEVKDEIEVQRKTLKKNKRQLEKDDFKMKFNKKAFDKATTVGDMARFHNSWTERQYNESSRILEDVKAIQSLQNDAIADIIASKVNKLVNETIKPILQGCMVVDSSSAWEVVERAFNIKAKDKDFNAYWQGRESKEMLLALGNMARMEIQAESRLENIEPSHIQQLEQELDEFDFDR